MRISLPQQRAREIVYRRRVLRSWCFVRHPTGFRGPFLSSIQGTDDGEMTKPAGSPAFFNPIFLGNSAVNLCLQTCIRSP
jgi:hypothetical protein